MRYFDVSAALWAIVLFSPVFISVTAILFFLNSGRPFFIQQRPGKNGEIFSIIKFKTMNDKKDENGNLLPDYQRLTLFGKFVRVTSLDELPQLINVLRGEMSLVGPRPLLPEYLELYNEEQNKRHNVKPGITGWAQVNGRNALTWEEKFRYDVEYVDNLSFMMDMIIIGITVQKVVRRHGVNVNNFVTSESFKGSAA